MKCLSMRVEDSPKVQNGRRLDAYLAFTESKRHTTALDAFGRELYITCQINDGWLIPQMVPVF